jgi:FAD/FMN-containing dehydrogenase
VYPDGSFKLEPISCVCAYTGRPMSGLELPTFVTRDEVTSWGRVIRRPQSVAVPAYRDIVEAWASRFPSRRLATGARRSYGDCCLSSDGSLLDMRRLDRLIAFDEFSGVLTAEAGLLLSDIMSIFVPRGWFPVVTPGTRNVTLGGALANDVHGKNHHRVGTFGNHVTSFTLVRSDRGVVKVDPQSEPALWAATIGGLGLTGVITELSIRLMPIRSSYLDIEHIYFDNIDAFIDLSDKSDDFEHTVAWLDCTSKSPNLGRGIYSRARWRRDGNLTPHGPAIAGVPFDAPAMLLNPTTLKSFNALYCFFRTRKNGISVVHYNKALHPLDAISDWNRLYGAAGFYQYQCVTPKTAGCEPIRALLDVISRSGAGSILAVLKIFGDIQSPGWLSFPMPGYTLSLDFRNRGADTLRLLERLDEIVIAARGRLYPAKDGRISREMFERGFGNLDLFMKQRDPACRSDLSERIGL